MWPGAGRLSLPLSMIAKTPRPTVSVPIKRALVPKSDIVIASSHGMVNTKSQREANASFPRPENSSAPTREWAAPRLSGLGETQGLRDAGTNVPWCRKLNPCVACRTITLNRPGNARRCPSLVTDQLLSIPSICVVKRGSAGLPKKVKQTEAVSAKKRREGGVVVIECWSAFR